MEDRVFAIIAAALLGFTILGWVAGFGSAKAIDKYKFDRQAVETVRDTEYVQLPPVHDTIIRTDTMIIRKAVATFKKAEPEPSGPPTTAGDSTVIRKVDSVAVIVPIERRTFTGNNYIATVEGWNPRLTDIWISQPAIMVTQTQTRTEKKHWSITIGPQGGYGLTPAGWQPYLGIGITAGYSF